MTPGRKQLSIQLPTALRARINLYGDVGKSWLSSLDDQLTELCNLWQVEPLAVLPGGSENLVMVVARRNSGDAIMKIGLPEISNLARQASVYRIARGRSYPKLYAHHAGLNALLLEPLGAPLRSVENTPMQLCQSLCLTLKNSWILVDEPKGLLSGRQWAEAQGAYIQRAWQALGSPCPDDVVKQALEYSGRRAQVTTGAVLVHGDAHPGNVLRSLDPHDSIGGHYKLIDPEGIAAEPACDLAVMMRGWDEQLLAGDTRTLLQARCEHLATLTDLDSGPVWEWGYLGRVAAGLFSIQSGRHKEGRQLLQVAGRLVS